MYFYTLPDWGWLLWDATGYSWTCACSAIMGFARRLLVKSSTKFDFRFVAKVVYSVVALLIFWLGALPLLQLETLYLVWHWGYGTCFDNWDYSSNRA